MIIRIAGADPADELFDEGVQIFTAHIPIEHHGVDIAQLHKLDNMPVEDGVFETDIEQEEIPLLNIEIYISFEIEDFTEMEIGFIERLVRDRVSGAVDGHLFACHGQFPHQGVSHITEIGFQD